MSGDGCFLRPIENSGHSVVNACLHRVTFKKVLKGVLDEMQAKGDR